MIKPKETSQEEARLAELNSYHILDTIEEADFDFLTQMASEICDTKISLISLISDDRQWFKSHHGLEIRETNKDYAFCAHALHHPNAPFIVEDSTKDERFFDNPLVVGEPHVVFYAGIPLVTENGFALGTLCAIDDVPKSLNDEQIGKLKMLASQVMNLLELRKRTKQLEIKNQIIEKTTKLFSESQKLANIGAWEMNLETGKTIWTDHVYVIHEVEPGFDHNKSNGLDFYHPEDRLIISRAIERTLAEDIPFDVTCRFITAKKNLKWVRATGGIWREEDGKKKLIGAFQDVTEQKEKELQIKSQRQVLQNVLDGTSAGTWEWNIHTGETTFNERWADIVGYSLTELAPISIETWLNLAHPDDLKESERQLQLHFEGKTDQYRCESRMKHKDGSWVWVYDQGKVIEWDNEGKPLKMYGTHLDITESKMAQINLAESEQYHKSLVRSIPDLLFILSREGVFLDFHAPTENLYVSPDDFIGKSIFDVLPKSIAEKCALAITELNEKDSVEISYSLPINNDLRHFNARIVELGADRIIVLATDDTERTNSIRNIESLLDVTKEQNERLKNFAHIVSHNLRSHAGSFSLLLELMKGEFQEVSSNEYFSHLENVAKNLGETIEHLNEVVEASIDTRQKYISLNLKEQVNRVIESLQSLAEGANVIMHNNVDSSVVVHAIPAYLESIILNFLTNGIKYRRESEDNRFVKISADRIDQYLVLSFEDNGIGFDVKKHGHEIFGMYKTFHGNVDAKGIGLFITKNQIEAMGGKVSVESQIGEGTTFRVSFLVRD